MNTGRRADPGRAVPTATGGRRRPWQGTSGIGAVVAIAIGLAPIASAAAPRLIDTEGAWAAFEDTREGVRICFAASFPETEGGAGLNRGLTYMTVGYWEGTPRKDQISVVAGFPYRDGSLVRAVVDPDRAESRMRFSLLPRGNRAWAESPAEDADLVAALRNGYRLRITGTSSRNNTLTDVYDLTGSADMIDRARAECGFSEAREP